MTVEAVMGRWTNAIRLTQKISHHYPLMVLAAAFGILRHLHSIAASVLSAYMVSLAVTGTLLTDANILLWSLVGCVVLRSVCSYLESLLEHKCSYMILAEFRILLYDAVEQVSPQLLLNMRTGQLASTLMSDVEVLEWFYAHTLGSAFIAVIVPFIVLIFLACISPWLSLAMIIFLIATGSIPFFMRKRADAQGRIVRDRLADASAVTVEGIHGLKEILTLNFQERYRKKNEQYMTCLYDSQIAYGKRLGLEGSLLEVSVGLSMIGVAVISLSLIFFGKIDSQYYPMLIILSILIFDPVIQITSMARNFGYITAAADRVFKVMEAKPEVEDKGTISDFSNIDKSISFENVSFQYGPDLPYALKDISFNVNPGEMVALVGHSGAGKSSCASLLLRFWDPSNGSIKIGGVDIRDFSLDALTTQTSAVLQDVYLFNTSVKENIRLGRMGATDQEVEEAAKLAQAHDFIVQLPNGYDTNVGERGAQLSGGQRQRIAIARALLKDAPILILDEAVSALDTQNEHELQKAFKEICRNRTTLVIAHRLSTVMNADRLLVFDKGRIVQSGTHEELIHQDGLYRELMQYQMGSKT